MGWVLELGAVCVCVCARMTSSVSGERINELIKVICRGWVNNQRRADGVVLCFQSLPLRFALHHYCCSAAARAAAFMDGGSFPTTHPKVVRFFPSSRTTTDLMAEDSAMGRRILVLRCVSVRRARRGDCVGWGVGRGVWKWEEGWGRDIDDGTRELPTILAHRIQQGTHVLGQPRLQPLEHLLRVQRRGRRPPYFVKRRPPQARAFHRSGRKGDGSCWS